MTGNTAAHCNNCVYAFLRVLRVVWYNTPIKLGCAFVENDTCGLYFSFQRHSQIGFKDMGIDQVEPDTVLIDFKVVYGLAEFCIEPRLWRVLSLSRFPGSSWYFYCLCVYFGIVPYLCMIGALFVTWLELNYLWYL